MPTSILYLSCILGPLLYQPGNCYKGLLVMTTGSRSNMNFFGSIIEALAESGHEVVLITPHKATRDEKGREVERVVVDDDRDVLLGNKFQLGFFDVLRIAWEYYPRQCINVLSDPNVKQVLKKKYDYIMLALVGSECFLGYAFENKLPVIYLNQNVLFSSLGPRFGIPIIQALSSSSFMGHIYPKTFWQRIKECITEQLLHFTFGWGTRHRTEMECRARNLWGDSIPTMDDLYKEPALLIVNNVRALEYPAKSLPPNVIYAGGIHIKPNMELAHSLEKWMNESGSQGFIYFSLGTSVRSEDMSEKNFKILLNVFGSLKQRVLFKWHSEDVENLPNNVKIIPWVPQQAVLNHPKIRAFVTHGGLFSIIEATYYQVPIVGIPVYMDQIGNVAQAVSEGWALKIEWGSLEEKQLTKTIEDVITNKTYQNNVNIRSKLMRDWPRNPKEDVVAWMNYFIKNNAPSIFRIPFENHYWFELYNQDVWLAIAIMIGIVLYILTSTLSCCFSVCCKKYTKNKED